MPIGTISRAAKAHLSLRSRNTLGLGFRDLWVKVWV